MNKMAIDDALKKLEGSTADKPAASKVEEADPTSRNYSNLFDVVRQYPAAIREYSKGKLLKKFDASAVAAIEKVADFIRFNNRFTVNFGKVSRDEAVRVLSGLSPDLKSLLEGTDLRTAIPEPFQITSDYYKFPVRLSEFGIELEQLRNFQYLTRMNIVIPNLEFLSLFIKDGEKLRQYANIRGRKEDFIAKIVPTWFEDFKSEFQGAEPFSTEDLKKYKDTFNDDNIADIILETRKLYENIRRCANRESYERRTALGEYLSGELKEHNPQLVYEE